MRMRGFARTISDIATRSAGVAAVFILGVSTAALAGEGAGPDAYKREIDEWHQARIERLKSPDGYLALVGLFPLEEGENTFGADEDNDLVFPAQAPAHVGVISVTGEYVSVEIYGGVDVTADDEPVSEMKLATDADGNPTVLALGSLRFFVIERAGRLYLRLKDRDSRLLKEFAGIDRFPVDDSWRIVARFEPYDPPKTLRIPTVLGNEIEQTCPGVVEFEVGGEVYRLEPTSTESGRLFFVFGDGTSGLETYGGGRFLVAAAPSDSGTVILDFNKAYIPPCAFTPFATCPLPHEANRLSLRVEAGEKNYGRRH